jgi:filamentous hemagglutinin family protein
MSDGVRSHRLGLLLLTALLAATPIQAQIVTDGTVGPKVSLSGGEIQIGADLGAQKGANLFHSFEKFGIATGQTATFTGPGEIKNVISRVTGGEVSNIDGKLASSVGQADLYFLNPAGVMFGPNAKLDVPGSFHVSTAHELRFADGASFSALDKTGSGLTVAPPEAFGFLDKPAGRITSNQSQLEIQPGKTLSLTGGDLELTGGTIAVAGGSPVAAPKAGGVFNAVSVASPGEVRVSDGMVNAAQLGSIRMADQRVTASGNGGGTVRIRAGTLTAANSAIDADNTGGWAGSGGIDLMASHLALGDSRISADTRSAAPGGAVTIKAGTMMVRNLDTTGVLDRRGIHSDTRSSGSAGAVNIQARSLTISGNGASITSDAQIGSTGAAGSVSIDAGTLTLSQGGGIRSDTWAGSDAGTVNVQAGSLLVIGDSATRVTGSGPFPTAISSDALTGSSGTGGRVTVVAGTLEILNGGGIHTDSWGNGDAGTVNIQAGSLNLIAGGDGSTGTPPTEISSNAYNDPTHDTTAGSGNVTVIAKDLTIRDGGGIRSDIRSRAKAGPVRSVNVHADRLLIIGNNRAGTGISSDVINGQSNRDASNITVEAGEIQVRSRGNIQSITRGGGKAGAIFVRADRLILSRDNLGITGIHSNADLTFDNPPSKSTGAAGNVTVQARDLQIDDASIHSNTRGYGPAGTVIVTADVLKLRNGAVISSDAIRGLRGDTAIGAAGNVIVEARDLLQIDDASIRSNTGVHGPAGTVTVTVIGGVLELRNGAVISSNATRGSSGDAGNVTIKAGYLEIRNGSTIRSDTEDSGSAGTVNVEADRLFVSGDDSVGPTTGITSDAHSGTTGNAGSVTVKAVDLKLRDGGVIHSDTRSSGSAGTVRVQANRLFVSRDGSRRFTGIASDATTGGGRPGALESSTGAAGSVIVTADVLELRNGGEIRSDTRAGGPAGAVSVQADYLLISGYGSQFPTGISSKADFNQTTLMPTSAAAGNVEIKANTLELRSGGVIRSDTQGGGPAGKVIVQADHLLSIFGDGSQSTTGVSSATGSLSTGAGGAIDILAPSIVLANGGIVSTESEGSGLGGSITLTAKDMLELDHADVRAKTTTADGGNVELSAGRLFYMHNNSTVTTSVAGGKGSGGNIVMNSPLLVLDNNQIVANAKQGTGGNITIRAGQLIRAPNNVITASGSVAGNITIAAPKTDVSSSLTVLPETFFDVSSQLRVACAARGGRPASSLSPGGRGGLPPDPGTPLAASSFGQSLGQQTATGSPTPLTAKPPPAAKPITVSGIPQPVLGSPRLTCRG